MRAQPGEPMSKRTTEFLPPVTYQGGKGRLAAQITEIIGLPIAGCFYDLCCGSGAISVAAVERGQDPNRITMVDLSPWGLFWKAVGAGTFDVPAFERSFARVPSDKSQIKAHVESIYRSPVNHQTMLYDFLLLQASAIGGAAVWIDGAAWRRSSGFKDLWLPTTTSSARSHVNPLMPMTETIVARVRVLAKRMRGVQGLCDDLGRPGLSVKASPGDVVYIDPPYASTTKYGYAVDAVAIASSLSVPCWVSEGRSLSNGALLLSSGRLKGGMTGDRKRAPNEEWLSPFGT